MAIDGEGAADDERAPAPESVIVEVSPGTALVYGEAPEGFELMPFRLVTTGDQAAIASALATASAAFNLGGQAANALLQVQPGLYRLAAESVAKMHSTGATLMQSGGQSLGTIVQHGQVVGQARFIPAGGLQAAGVLAAVGPAMAMIAIQVQLNELQGLISQNLELTEGVLKTVRHEQWAELTGLQKAVGRAIEEAGEVGEVTPLIWQNVHGSEKDLQKHRDLFRRNVKNHAATLALHKGHTERLQYIEKNGEAMLLDLHSLLLAHRSWFEYQALRAGRARLEAGSNPSEARLLEKITSDASSEYHAVVEDMAGLLETLTRELSILAELPGKQTIPFTKASRSARDVAAMATQLLAAVERIGGSARKIPAPLERPATTYAKSDERMAKDLRILRWHVRADEEVLALAMTRTPPTGAIESVGDGIGRGLGALGSAFEAAFRRQDILEAATEGLDRDDLLVSVTSQRVLIADVDEFRSHGVIRKAIPTSDIRYVRFRDDNPEGVAEVDLITRTDDYHWRFGNGSATDAAVKRLGALLADQMAIPDSEREALLVALPFRTEAPKEITR